MKVPQAPDVSDPAEDLLLQHFSGKRQGERVSALREVSLVGSAGPVRGRTVDVSAGGALIQILDAAFTTAASEGRASTCVGLADRHFHDGVRLEFRAAPIGLPIVVEGEIVRITVGPDAKEGVRAGCRFLRALSPAERVLLGVDPAPIMSGSPPVPPAVTLESSFPKGERLVPRRGAAPQVLLFATMAGTAGPVCAGRVVALRGRQVEIRVETSGDASRLAARIREGDFRLTMVRALERLWDVSARTVSVRAVGSTAAVELETTVQPPPAARRHFRRS
jgi:hypothetical protein